MKKNSVYGMILCSIMLSCYDSDDRIIVEEPINTAPVATDLSISGDLETQANLTALYTFNDVDDDTETNSLYQWYTATNDLGADKTAISGATNSTYSVTTDDIDYYIGFEVTPYDGIDFGETVTSSFVGPVVQKELAGEDLVLYLRTTYAPPSLANDVYDYDAARDLMYSEIWIQNSDQLSGIYSGYQITMDFTKDPSTYAYESDINTEHIYPQGKGAGEEPMRSDMHHLAPTKVNVNTARGSLPFANITDSQTNTWYQAANTYSTDPDGSAGESEAYSKLNATAFEPNDNIKGDIARAVMYFYTMYDSADEEFFNSMKSTLLEWHTQDPVDDFERSRNTLIKTYQGNDNPFILDETLANRAFSE